MGGSKVGVEVIRARLAGRELALELRRVSSVLTNEEAQGIEVIDPSPWLGSRSIHEGHVALVLPEVGPPVGVRLGEVLGFERWPKRRLHIIPDWLAQHLPAILFRGCGWDEELGAIWLLDIDHLIQAWHDDRKRESEVLRRQAQPQREHKPFMPE